MHRERKSNHYAEQQHEVDPIEEVYARWADQLDALPNGFPRTQSGVELRLLKKIARPDEAWLAGRLGREYESVEEISSRVGLPDAEVSRRLTTMQALGIVRVTTEEGVDRYRAEPFIVGFFESHKDRMDSEFAQLFEQYMMLHGARGILGLDPPVMRVVPAQQTVEPELVLPYDDVRAMLLGAKSFGVIECVCRIEQDLLESRKCSFPLKNCLYCSTDELPEGTESITQEQALAILDDTEELGLVHLVDNWRDDYFGICNCCGCCCGVLRGITDWGIENSVAKANYLAEIDPDECQGCEICIGRCQVNAISISDEVAVVEVQRCIGCGLCMTSCPEEAVALLKKPESEIVHPPRDFSEWEDQRLRNRRMSD